LSVQCDLLRSRRWLGRPDEPVGRLGCEGPSLLEEEATTAEAASRSSRSGESSSSGGLILTG